MPTPTPSPFKVETVSEDDDDDKFGNLPQMTAPSGEPLKSGLPIYNMQDWFDVPVNLPQFSPEELLGLTFLCNAGDGERTQAKIVKKILDQDAENHEQIKMLISYDNDRVEEVIKCNKLCDVVAEQHNKEACGEDKIFMFCHIVDHKGPLKPGDSEYNRSWHNVKIEWEDASVTAWEPLTVIGKCNPVTCAVCAKEHGLLNKPGWKQFRKYARKAKTLQCLVNNAKQAQRFGQIGYKFGVCIPHNEKEAMMLDRENGNMCWQEAIEAETGQLFKYKVFKDLGKNVAVPKEHQLIQLRIVFDVKQSLKQKARIDAW